MLEIDNRRSKQISVRFNPRDIWLLDEIEALSVPGSGYEDERTTAGVLRTWLERYFDILELGRREMREALTPADLGLVVDVCNGIIISGYSTLSIWAEVEDSLPDGTARKWSEWAAQQEPPLPEVNGPALVEKLRGLSVAGNYALVDAVERFWRPVSRGEDHDNRAAALRDLLRSRSPRDHMLPMTVMRVGEERR